MLTAHARFEMDRRGLTEGLVERVLREPGERWEVRPGRHVLQSKISMGDPAKLYVVRVVIDTDRIPNEVVTAYRTGKIEKYWRQRR
ncbi:MAG: DUF4258 domain-containing protein [Deltaproteobacteria bacterium]|nr:DUF4258 domain-containing protein [Deltaproteobacteria bacterium]